MKTIKKLVFAVLTATMLLSLAACGEDTASSQLKKDISDFKKADIAGTLIDESSLSDENKAAYKDFIKMTQDFDYTISDEKISEDGNSATVKLEITSYDFGTAYLDAWDAVIASKKKLSEENEFYTVFFEQVEALEDMDYVSDVTIKCTKGDDGKWTTDLASNSDFRNAIMGDMINIVKELANL